MHIRPSASWVVPLEKGYSPPRRIAPIEPESGRSPSSTFAGAAIR